ncbi:hypothetical protein [Rudaea sp. 3F27F6]|uniref:hypothetical protein n=2 Tax=unclassified Rudaea TaxID=2627037 RepID=UPI0010F476D1|nr:hypothetical protein [Rudaea sp. 3F27F6]
MYEFVVTDFSAVPAEQRHTFPTRDAATRFGSSLAARRCAIFIAHIVDHVDYGNFYVWYNEDLAFVRLDEHREHYASDPLRASFVGPSIQFQDEDNELFEVLPSQVVGRAQAAEALQCWLTSGLKLSSLSWS